MLSYERMKELDLYFLIRNLYDSLPEPSAKTVASILKMYYVDISDKHIEAVLKHRPAQSEIYHYLRACGLKTSKIAEVCGVHPQTVRNMLTRKPKENSLRKELLRYELVYNLHSLFQNPKIQKSELPPFYPRGILRQSVYLHRKSSE